MARWTRSRVAAPTCAPLMTFETVLTDTPARAATSFMPGERGRADVLVIPTPSCRGREYIDYYMDGSSTLGGVNNFKVRVVQRLPPASMVPVTQARRREAGPTHRCR